MKWLNREIPSRWLDNLVSYVEAYDPDFGSRLQPATEDEVTHLESLVGRPLPASYRVFLTGMGRAPGVLLDGVSLLDLDLDGVIEAYQEMRDEPDLVMPEGLIWIGTGLADAYQDVCLRIDPDHPDREPDVVDVFRGQVRLVLAGSLPHLLFQQAFNKYELGSFPDTSDYALDRDVHTLAGAAQAAEEIGFAPKWFCDQTNWCGRAEAAAISIHQPAGQGGWIRIAGRGSGTVARHGHRLQVATGVTFIGKRGHTWG